MPTAPTAPAPAPTFAAADVISLFSNAYTNVPVTTWSAGWDEADVEDIQIAGNDVKKYTNLVFVGIEFIAPTDQRHGDDALLDGHLDRRPHGTTRLLQDQAGGLRGRTARSAGETTRSTRSR